jgi:hypothetical protein
LERRIREAVEAAQAQAQAQQQQQQTTNNNISYTELRNQIIVDDTSRNLDYLDSASLESVDVVKTECSANPQCIGVQEFRNVKHMLGRSNTDNYRTIPAGGPGVVSYIKANMNLIQT